MHSTGAENCSILLEVQGLCCNEEKRLIERKVGALDGVSDFSVDVVLQHLRVEYDPSRLSPQDIIRSVSETGMKALSAQRSASTKYAWWREARILLLLASGVLTTTALVGAQLGMATWVARVLYVLAIVSGGFYPAKAGLSAARTLSMNINTLLILGVVGAVGLDLWDEAAILVFVYSLGNVLESYVVRKARGAIKSFVDLSPKEALVRKGGRESVIPADKLRVGDTVMVRPGEKIPIDGTVVAGESYVDEAAVTGEPMPTGKSTGSDVFAGTINQKGSLTVRVTRTSNNTTLAKIIHSIEEAHTKKSRYQLFGERFARVYTPLMFMVGVLVAVLPPLLSYGGWQDWMYRALVVFVVSCSCGLALSVPVAVIAAVGNAARHGVLVKGGLFLEKAQKVKVVAFDKTGTLTTGRPSVTRIIPADGAVEAEILSLAASIEALSEHPLGEAIVRKAREAEVFRHRSVHGFEAVSGRGVRAHIDGKEHVLGNLSFVEDSGVELDGILATIRELENEAHTTVILAVERRPLGIFAIADTLKPESTETVRQLKSQGLDVVMLTGDASGTASAIARAIEISDYRAGLMPQDKIDHVASLHKQRGAVMMIGDGINDSPAMATADVGVAMGAAGTDVAMEAGDIVLLADDLSRIPQIIRLSRRTVANIKQNIFLSLLVVAILVPSALLGRVDLLSGLLINEGAALIVVLNGLRLIR
ncbi:MAG: cation-translocating P-type ATPase [Candidatus Krumholzibacteria bacterium]|nr:cation-translocating P-type ATPase [Candidatus Krumholzibacteria bacterium]